MYVKSGFIPSNNNTMKRNVEVYIGYGSDNGTWITDYVEIPRNTPEDKIESVAIDQGKSEHEGFIFVGIYAIPSLEESDEMLDYDDEESDKAVSVGIIAQEVGSSEFVTRNFSTDSSILLKPMIVDWVRKNVNFDTYKLFTQNVVDEFSYPVQIVLQDLNITN